MKDSWPRNEEASRLKRKNADLEEQLSNLEQQLKKKVEEARLQDAQSQISQTSLENLEKKVNELGRKLARNSASYTTW